MGLFQGCITICVVIININYAAGSILGVSCPEIKAPNLRTRLRSKGRIVNFKCKSKFERVGVKFAVCLDTGHWSQQIPTCVGTTCRRPESGPNMIVEELYKGGVLKFTCGAGLIRTGPETLMCDGNKWNDEPPKCIEGTTLQCDFEDHALCGWSQDFEDDFDWAWHTGETPTAQTGPRSDHTTNTSEGHYLYMESSAPQAAGQKTRLLSPPYSPENMINMCLEFYYHMNGPDGVGEVGDLDVYVKPLTIKTLMLVESHKIFHQEGNQGDEWQAAVVHLPHMTETFQIVFQATRLKSWSADIAIDDVRLYNCVEETTTSSGPVDGDDADDDDNNQEPSIQKTERRPIITTAKTTTDSTSTIRTTPSTTTASTLPTTIITTGVTSEKTSTSMSTSTVTAASSTQSTKNVTTPSIRTTTLGTTVTPTSTSSTPTTTMSSKPTTATSNPTTTSSTSTTTIKSTRPTTVTVKLTTPTTVTETTTTSTTTTTSSTTTMAVTTPTSTAETSPSSPTRTTTIKSTSKLATSPISARFDQTTMDTDDSAEDPRTKGDTEMEDWSTPQSQTTDISLFTTDTSNAGYDNGINHNNGDVYDYDNDSTTTPDDNDPDDDKDEDDHETTKSISSAIDYVDYDSTKDNHGLNSTFDTSPEHNGSQPSARDNEENQEESAESESTQTETGNGPSSHDLGHRAVRAKDGHSSSTTEVLPLIIGVASAVLVAALVIAVLAYLWARNQRRKQEKDQEDQMNIITEYVETNLST